MPTRVISLIVLSLIGCTDTSTTTSPRIDRIHPAQGVPGELITIDGENFGEPGHVAVAGRSLDPLEWGDGRIQVHLPADIPAGEVWVVAMSRGRTTPPAPYSILGDPTRNSPPPRRFSPRPGERRDGPYPDVGPPRPDTGAGELLVEFDPDPTGRRRVQLVQQPSEPGDLVLDVILAGGAEDAWGIAFHMTYDRNVLRFARQLEPNLDLAHHAARLKPGRLALGHLINQPRVARLRFRVVGPGSTRLTFPRRHRTLRNADNTELSDLNWAGGSLTVREGR